MQHITSYTAAWILMSFILLSVVLAGCNATPSPATPPGLDLTVSSIEVTQAIQTTTTTIDLVAQRSTEVRATLGIVTGSAPVAGITGRLHVFVNGAEITPAVPQRANENDTLNFELSAPSGITVSTDVDIRVDITVPGDTVTTNNAGKVGNLTAVARTTPTLYFTRVDYTPAGLGLPALADIQSGVGDAFVRGIYPVNDADPNLYREGFFPTLTFSQDSNGNSILDSFPDGSALISVLASRRQLIVNGGLGASNNTFLYGWIAGNPISGNGLGQRPGFNAYGNTQDIRYQRTYAHELGHNFGLSHNSRSLDEVGWDVRARLDGNPAGNNTSGWVKPTTMNDIMRGGQFTNSAWVDTETYNFFFNSAILANASPDNRNLSASGLLASIAVQEQEEFSERVVVIQGIFDPEGEKLVYLEPVFRFPWPSQPTAREETGSFVAEVTDEAGNVTTALFDALVADDSGEVGEQQVGFFEVMLAVPPDLEIVSARISDAGGERELGGFQISEPPEIIIVAPQEGAELEEKTEVAWETRDPDTAESNLMYQVAYSPDGGLSWVPIAVDVPGTERGIVFNSTEIQASQGKGVIRVFMSDGLNTEFADVSNLTTLAAKYPAPEA